MNFDFPNASNPFVTLIFLAVWFLWFSAMTAKWQRNNQEIAELIARIWHLKRLGE
jgi:hypothetical protein